LQVVVDRLRAIIMEEKPDKNAVPAGSYSALTQDPKEWTLEPGKPCGGER
jgi:hypothetical protein